MGKYSIGVDFGTQSCRSILVDVETGQELAAAVKEYTHGVITEVLPDGKTRLKDDWALQHPQDYLNTLGVTIKEVLKEAGVPANDVIGVGLDFTASTILPVDMNGIPLCMLKEHKSNPHSYVKLWKHHAAQDEANLLNEIAATRGEELLQRYGGKISSEWMIPKIWQILNEAPEIYYAAHQFIEAADWIVFQLTGEYKRSSCFAGYKAMWDKKKGYPAREFFKSLDPQLENVVMEKLSEDIFPAGTWTGMLTVEGVELTGLDSGTSVAVPIIDAHAAVPAVGITEPGKLLMIIGTSTCHLVLSDKEVLVPGISGVVEDGVIPGLFGYEAGQSCVGDQFEWFIKNCLPGRYFEEAKLRGIDIHQLLTEKASSLAVGESGLLALDWWNGNRSTLVDADLTGMILGANLQTKPEEIYRALIEATAYGSKIIIDTFRAHGVPIDEVYACGGIAEKNPLLMQIYSDVLDLNIYLAGSSQAPALGSAMLGAVAAGKDAGGYDNIHQAAKIMGKVKEHYYQPIPENTEMYRQLFEEYKKLYQYFGTGENQVMKKLKSLKSSP